MSIIANAVTIGKNTKNYTSVTATTVTVAAGATNMGTGTITAQNVTVSSGGKNIGAITATGVVTVAGTNSGTVSGSVVLNGGTNTNTAVINGSLTINSGNSAAAVTGDIRMTGGTNTGTVTGNLYVLSNAANTGNVTGNIVVATGINTGPVVPPGYSGSVIQVVSGSLTTTTYNQGSTVGSPSTTNGTYYNLDGDSKVYTYDGASKTAVNGLLYNLQGDSKAYTYTDGTGSLFSGNAYNLTGDSRAYSWASGVKGALFSGTIGSSSYVNGVLQAPTSASFTVTGGEIGTLYTASGGSVTAGPVYSDSALETQFTGFFVYSGTNYYASSGTLVGYRPWTVTGDTSPLYTVSTGDVTTDTVYSNSALDAPFTGVFTYSTTTYYADAGAPHTYRAWTVANDTNGQVLYTAATGDITTGPVKTTSGLGTAYEGVFTYNSTDYYATTGTPVAYLTYGVSGDDNDGFLYSLVDFAAGPTEYLYTEPALVNKYTGYYFYNQGYYAADGVVNTYRAWTINGNSNVTVTYTAPDAADITSGTYLVYSDTALETPYADFYGYGGLTYLSSATGVPALLTGNNFGPNGSMFDYGTYGTDNPTALSSGTYQLANGGLWYNLDSMGAGTIATAGIYADADGYYRSFVGDGTATEADGTYVDSGDGLYYLYPANGTRSRANGIYEANDGHWYSFDNGTGNYLTGIYQADSGTWYTFDGQGGTQSIGAGNRQDAGSYWRYFVGDGTSTGYSSGLAEDAAGLWRSFDGAGGGPLATGTKQAANGSWYTFDGAGGGQYANGIILADNGNWYSFNGATGAAEFSSTVLLANDGKVYSFDGAGGASTFYGVFDNIGTLTVVSNGTLGSTTITGVYKSYDDGSFYMYTDSVKGDAHTGGAFYVDAWYEISAGIQSGTLFTGSYNSGGIYRNIDSGAATATATNEIRKDAADDRYYYFTSGSKGAQFDGALLIDGTYSEFVGGLNMGLFTGAYANGDYFYAVESGVASTTVIASGIRKYAGDGKWYTYTGSGNTHYLFNGVVNISTSYFTVTDGVVDNNSYASGIKQLVSNAKYYTFTGDGTLGALFTGAAQDDNGSFRNVDAGVRDPNSYATGIRQLAGDSKYYRFDGTNNNNVFFNGAYFDGTYYRPVTDGIRGNSVYANGVLQLDSEQKYYTFNGTGNAGVLFTGVVFAQDSKYRYIDAGVDVALFNGAWLDNNNYRLVTDGIRDNGFANGVLLLDSDLKYYRFNNGSSEGLLSGAYFDGTYYRPVTDGIRGNGFANGVLLLASDLKYYTFDGINGTTAVLFTGAWFDGTYYRPVTDGVRDNSVYANGVLQLDSEQKYYTFNNSGSREGLLRHGGALHNGAWYNVLNGERQISYFSYGAVYSSSYYSIVSSSGILSGEPPSTLRAYMLTDGTWYKFSSSGQPDYQVYPFTYTIDCDQAAGTLTELIIVATSLNIGDRPVQIGTTLNSTPTYAVPQKPSNTFVVSGFKYRVNNNGLMYDGLIDDIYTCTDYPD